MTSFQFDKNIAILFYDKYDCGYFDLSESIGVDVAEEVEFNLNIQRNLNGNKNSLVTAHK